MKKLTAVLRQHPDEQGQSVRFMLDDEVVMRVFFFKEDGMDIAKILYQNKVLTIPLAKHN